MHRRTRTTLWVFTILILVVTVAVYLRKKAPPEVSRLLPESDGIVYINLRPLRTLTRFERRSVTRDPVYEQFVRETGFEFERDLEQAAFALHRMANPNGPNGPVAFSEIFQGHFDDRKLSKYFHAQAFSEDEYSGHTIWNIPSEGRMVRVTLLGYDMVAVSNTPTPEQIHSILDRYRTAGLPFSGSSLLAEHYSAIPLLSVAWGIGQVGMPLGEGDGRIHVGGLSVPIPSDTTFIVSARPAGSFSRALRLHVEELTGSDQEAEDSARNLSTLLNLVKTAQGMPMTQAAHAAPDLDAEWRNLLSSAQIDHNRKSVIVTANLPVSLIESLASDTPAIPADQPQPAPEH